jgi:hypothetical protein
MSEKDESVLSEDQEANEPAKNDLKDEGVEEDASGSRKPKAEGKEVEGTEDQEAAASVARQQDDKGRPDDEQSNEDGHPKW